MINTGSSARQRMHGLRSLAAAVLTLTVTATVGAAEQDPRYAAVAALGELNGMALQCKYLDQVRRMKAAVVMYAPKERSYGLAFDEATNEAFLAFARHGEACQTHDDLERQVGHRIDRMAEAFTAR